MDVPKRLVVGISGASGAALAIRLLESMRKFPEWETHLVVSRDACRTIELETPYTPRDVEELASRCYPVDDVGAAIASGTFKTEGMIVAPCSMKTLAGIAHGFSENLLLRAADVTLKERRKLVLLARESPLSAVHLNNMLMASHVGAIILPPMLSYYYHPASVEDMTNHVVGKVLDIFGLEIERFQRWTRSSGTSRECDDSISVLE